MPKRRKPPALVEVYKPTPIQRPGSFVDTVAIPIVEIQVEVTRCPRCRSRLELRVAKEQDPPK